MGGVGTSILGRPRHLPGTDAPATIQPATTPSTVKSQMPGCRADGWREEPAAAAFVRQARSVHHRGRPLRPEVVGRIASMPVTPRRRPEADASSATSPVIDLPYQSTTRLRRRRLRLRMPLKEGRGDSELLRYFELAANALALEEAGLPRDDALKAELADLRLIVKHFFRVTT